MIIWKWVTLGSPTATFSTTLKNFAVLRTFIHCTVAFDASVNNNISFGYSGSTQAYGTTTAVATTGWKTITAGASIGLNTTSRVIQAYYTQSGTAATVGKALVGIEIESVPLSP